MISSLYKRIIFMKDIFLIKWLLVLSWKTCSQNTFCGFRDLTAAIPVMREICALKSLHLLLFRLLFLVCCEEKCCNNPLITRLEYYLNILLWTKCKSALQLNTKSFQELWSFCLNLKAAVIFQWLQIELCMKKNELYLQGFFKCNV